MKLGGRVSKRDFRDLKLAKVQIPVPIPDSYQTDISKLMVLWQGHLPVCYAHAAAFFKSIQETLESGTPQSFSPRFTCIKIKQFDGYPLEEGSDQRSVFKSLLKDGACDLNLMQNKILLPLEEYARGKITSEMEVNAQPRIIKSYAFANADFDSVKRAIYQNGAVLLTLYVGDTWWGQTIVRPYARLDGGHLVVGYGYDNNYIYIVDSADRDVPYKQLSNYPIRECGVAIDLPNEFVRQQIQKLAWLQQLVELYRQVIALMKGRKLN